MNRVGDRLLQLILIVMIGTSLYLTYLIWMSPVGHDTLLENGTVKDVVEKKTLKKETDVFLPLKVRHQVGDKNQETQNENLLKNIQLLMNDSRYSEGRVITEKNVLDYQRKVALENGFELVYAVRFSVEEYIKIFGLNLSVIDDDALDFKFTKIQVDFDKEKIRLLNDDKTSFLDATIEKNGTELLEILRKAEVQWIPLEQTYSFLNDHYLTTAPLKLKQYSYISSARPYTLFRDAFFTNPKSVRSNSSAFDTYLYESGESLAIKQNQEIVHFQGSAKVTDPFDIFATSFNYMQRIGSSYGSTRMIDQSRNEIDYRTFVEGFPVFGSNSEGKILFDFKEENRGHERNVSIQANLTSLQIPIPSAEEIVLPASQEVLETLYYQGLDTNLVQMLIIGYEWKNLEDTGVVDLIPRWYIKYGDQWFSYDFLLESLMEEERE